MSLENESKAVQYEGEVFEVYLQGDGGLQCRYCKEPLR